MSQKNTVNLKCLSCDHTFEANLFRTIWGEQDENRKLVMDDLVNVVECPSCHVKTKVDYALFYNDTKVFCGVWWEPLPEPEIDQCVTVWAQMWGEDNYMVRAPRIGDWQEFKDTISKFYTGELKGLPPTLPKHKMQQRKIMFRLPNMTKQHILTILGAIVLFSSISIAIICLIQITELKSQLVEHEQEIERLEIGNSSEISDLEGKIADNESQINDLEDAIEELQDYSHYHY